MTREEAALVTRERFHEWSDLLEADSATPLLLVGVAQGDVSRGDLYVCLPDNALSTDDLILLLLRLVENLQRQRPPLRARRAT